MKKIALVLALGSMMGSANALELASDDLVEGGLMDIKHVFDQWGCGGKNISPHLKWSDVPEGTKSFVVTVYDPDAPTISGFWHWVAFNIPANVTELPQGAGSEGSKLMPQGVIQSNTDFNAQGYGGPCPPTTDGMHRYQFSIHAMKVDKLPFGADINPASVGYQIHVNSLATATITATYNRD
ncbi:YbhB/YbcL family Raf kinase inhibitor-like protein [Motilimonas sp. KMU-193]|uniref:YbhB/YbcL family Raf kinase inhibitor-like protein n=1 Tax=Motilimonas sp. KMU-193 TaxID=3388668 RepID=UPI00396B3482